VARSERFGGRGYRRLTTLMSTEVSVVDPTAHTISGSRGSGRGTVLAQAIPALTLRVRAEYVEMPGLRLTLLQAARLFGVPPHVAHAVLDDLVRASVLTCSDRGTYSLSR
jgi:hypothetical protein